MLKPVDGKVLLSVLIGFVRIALSLGFVWVSKALVDIATGVRDAYLPIYIGLMIGIMLFQIICRIGALYWERYLTVNTQNEMRRDTFSRVLRSEWGGRETFSSGDTVNRLEEDIRVVVELICVRIPDVIITLCQLVAASAFLLTMAPNLLWILIALMVVAVFGSKMFFKPLRELTARIRARDSEVQQLLQENLVNRVLVLTLFGVEKVVSRLVELQNDIYANTMKRMNLNAIASAFMGFGFNAGYAVAFLWGIFGIRNGTVTFGMMTAFLQLVGQVQRPIADVSRHIPAFIHALTSVERIMELNELPTEPQGEAEVLSSAPGIRLSDVTFSYPDSDRKVFSHFSCDFAPGTLTAIVGPTGVGKSTLIRMIMALLKPSSGKVELYSDGVSYGTAPKFRCNFMYVPQGNSLMSGTVRENLALANSSATEAQMEEVLHIAAADFVFDRPGGLDSVCGEVGSGLSEGQAQRIAIARALLHSGGVLILDEATSALDPETERQLLKNIYDTYHSAKTILFISHRETVLSFADTSISL